ncbi:MAG: hypothetical protein RLZZ323_715 [Bacteroidota bacterium]
MNFKVLYFFVMKKHHLIGISIVSFIVLFVNEDIGLNLAIFALVLIGLLVYSFKQHLKGTVERVLLGLSILSCLAFAWYGDFASFVAVFLSVLVLQFRIQTPQLKSIQVVPLLLINSLATSIRFFQFSKWLPEIRMNTNFAKILVAYVIIPLSFLSVFFLVYSFGSDHFSSLFTNYTFEFNPYQLIFVVVFGTYFSFSFWNYWVPDICLEMNSKLQDELKEGHVGTNQSIFSILDTDFKRKSGEITFLLLNLLLLLFLVTFNYEQFFESIASSQLSVATHERVNAVLFSIFLSIVVVLVYFKGEFNFDSKAKTMKILAKTWMVLNGFLIVSTLIVNTEYIASFGLTYKRLGVYAFLFLAAMSLIFTAVKITKIKSNAYVFNQMIWYCYGMILLSSFVNWGNIITIYNISVNKGLEPIFISNLNYNDAARRQFFLENKLDGQYVEQIREKEIKTKQSATFLSKSLYYEFLK